VSHEYKPRVVEQVRLHYICLSKAKILLPKKLMDAYRGQVESKARHETSL